MKKLLLLASLAIATIISASAQDSTVASHPKKVSITQQKKMKEKLNLTDDQSKQLKVIDKGYAGKIKAVKSNTALTEDQKKAQLKTLHQQRKDDFQKILTPDQKDKLTSIKKHDGKKKSKKTDPATPNQ